MHVDDVPHNYHFVLHDQLSQLKFPRKTGWLCMMQPWGQRCSQLMLGANQARKMGGGLVQYSKWGYCCNSTGVQKEDLNQLPSALHQSALWEITSQHKDRPEAQHSKAVASNKNIVDKNRGDGVWATDYSIVSNKTLEKHTTGIQRNAECLDSYFIWVLGN